MSEIAFIALIVGFIVLAALARKRAPGAAPVEVLIRLHAGVADKAEWMASDKVVQRVIDNYLAGQKWIAEQPLQNYQTCLNGLVFFFNGPYRAELTRLLKLQQARGGARFVGVLRASHQISVRHFSEDGASCLLLDHQSDRRMATYDYWTKQRVNTQDLGSSTLVYRMALDRGDGRWRLSEFIQELPSGWETLPAQRFQLTETLPQRTRRDVGILN